MSTNNVQLITKTNAGRAHAPSQSETARPQTSRSQPKRGNENQSGKAKPISMQTRNSDPVRRQPAEASQNPTKSE